MPEGHTVHRVAAMFREHFVGHTVTTSSPQGRFSGGAQALDGRVVHHAHAVGKQLFVTFSDDAVLRVHLGIYGAWSVHTSAGEQALGAPRAMSREEGFQQVTTHSFPPEPVGQVRLRVMTDSCVADLRGPTACELMSPDEADAIAAQLGPDPLVDSPRLGLQRFVARMDTSAPVALALMNQKIVSGIGNVYRAELLFRHRLDPFVPSRDLSPETLSALWKDWTGLLRHGVKTGVMVTRSDLTPAQARRAIRESRLRHFVYKRDGKACLVCGEKVVMVEAAARKLYYCPTCQVGRS